MRDTFTHHSYLLCFSFCFYFKFLLVFREKCYSARGTICSAVGGPANSLLTVSSDTTFTVLIIATSSTILSGRRRWSGTAPDRTANANSTRIAKPGLPATLKCSEWPLRSSVLPHRSNKFTLANCWRRINSRVKIDSSFCASKRRAKASAVLEWNGRQSISSLRSTIKPTFNPCFRRLTNS